MDTQTSKSFAEEAQEYEDLSKDPRLADIFTRLNNRQTNENLILQNQNEEETQNFKNFISKNYLKKTEKKPALSSLKNSARPLKEKSEDEENENDNEHENEKGESINHGNKLILDPDEEQKIEDHIKQYKVNSVQQYSILRHYFLNWHEICEKMRELENHKKRGNHFIPADPDIIKGITTGSGQPTTSKGRDEKMLASPSKIQKEGIESKGLEQKFQQPKK